MPVFAMHKRRSRPLAAPITFWHAFRTTYGQSVSFLMVCPLLALIPVAFELMQHVVEYRIGMYSDIASASAVGDSAIRVAFGFMKAVALIVPTYWITRFLTGRGTDYARRLEPRALRCFGVFLLTEVGIAAVEIFLLPRKGPGAVFALLVGQVVTCLLCAWSVAAPIGNAEIGLVKSVDLMRRHLPWTFAFLLATMLPLMAVHYALAVASILGPKSLLWGALMLDALVVGYLSIVLIASNFYAAIRAAAVAQVVLLPTTIGAADVYVGAGASGSVL